MFWREQPLDGGSDRSRRVPFAPAKGMRAGRGGGHGVRRGGGTGRHGRGARAALVRGAGGVFDEGCHEGVGGAVVRDQIDDEAGRAGVERGAGSDAGDESRLG